MAGRTLILQHRDRKLLQELTVLRIADGEQLMLAGEFTSASRANRRLLQLVQAGFLNRNFIASDAGGLKAIYWLSSRGAVEIRFSGTLISRKRNAVLVSDSFLQHQLLVNDIHLALK